MERAAELVSTHAIGAIVDLREEDRDDQEHLRELGVVFLHLPAPDMDALGVEGLDRGVAFVRGCLQQSHRALIHCQHGIGRSPLLALCVLVDSACRPSTPSSMQGKTKRPVAEPRASMTDGRPGSAPRTSGPELS